MSAITDWENIPRQAITRAAQSAATVETIRDICAAAEPVPKLALYDLSENALCLVGIPDTLDNVVEKLRDIVPVTVKEAYSPTLRNLAETINLAPGTYHPLGIPNHPGALSSMLTGGLLGASAGYGVGWLAEKMLPGDWQRRRLRRTLALLGGAMGALPGGVEALMNHAAGRGVGANSLFPDARPVNDRPFPGLRTHPVPAVPSGLHEQLASVPAAGMPKLSDDAFDMTGFSAPGFNVNAFNQTVWQDARVADQISPPAQAALTGAVTAAAVNPYTGRMSPIVTPADMGRLAVGMGSGYVAGSLVGKALGFLMGMPPAAQDRLKNTGIWAGVAKAMLPVLFGG